MPPTNDHRGARFRPILRGFTLIELVMVIAIIAIMASVAIPRFAGTLTRQRVEAAASRTVNDLNLARQRARFTSTPQTVAFDVTAASYRLVGLADPDHPTTDYEVPLGEQPYEVGIALADFGGDAEITFDGFGVPGSGGSVVIEAGGYSATVTVDPDSGRASWQ